MKVKLRPQVFRDAAELIETNCVGYGCHALRQASDTAISYNKKTAYEEYFAKWFKPEEPIYREESLGWFGKPSIDENQKKRILALLLCADILERQNKKK